MSTFTGVLLPRYLVNDHDVITLSLSFVACCMFSS